jgi:hypothetical protein
MHKRTPKANSYMGAISIDYLRGVAISSAKHWKKRAKSMT